MSEWNKLSMKDRALYIRNAVSRGVNDVDKIREDYHLYATGGNLYDDGSYLNIAKAHIRHNEGFTPVPIRDGTLGKAVGNHPAGTPLYSVGYGFNDSGFWNKYSNNISARYKNGITRELAEEELDWILRNDAVPTLKRWYGSKWNTFNDNQKAALIDTYYQSPVNVSPSSRFYNAFIKNPSEAVNYLGVRGFNKRNADRRALFSGLKVNVNYNNKEIPSLTLLPDNTMVQRPITIDEIVLDAQSNLNLLYNLLHPNPNTSNDDTTLILQLPPTDTKEDADIIADTNTRNFIAANNILNDIIYNQPTYLPIYSTLQNTPNALDNIAPALLITTNPDEYLNNLYDKWYKFEDGGPIGNILFGPLGNKIINKTWDAAKRRIYRTVTPLDYNIRKATKEFVSGNNRNMNATTSSGNEEWAKYLGVSYNSPTNFEPAIYTPTMGGATYNNVVKFKDESLVLSDEVLRQLILNKLNTGKNTMLIKGNGTGLGSYTVSMGEDDKGKYISYYDDWDINPFKGVSAKTKVPIISDIENIVPETHPFTVYGRRYYTNEDLLRINAKAYGGPIVNMFQDGGDIPPQLNWPALGSVLFNTYPDNTFVGDSINNRGYISTITPNQVTALWGGNPNDYEPNRNIYNNAEGKYVNLVNNEKHLVNPKFGENSIIYNPNYTNRDAISLDALHIMHDNPVYEDLYNDYVKSANDNTAIYSAAYDEFGDRGIEILDKYYAGLKLSNEEQEIIKPIFDGFLRRQLAPGYMQNIEGGYEAPVDLNNTTLGNKVDNIKDYLESYQLPEVTVTPNKHSLGGPIVDTANRFDDGGLTNLQNPSDSSESTDSSNSPNIFRLTNSLGESRYVYLETPGSKEIEVKPLDSIYADPALWTYEDSKGNQYIPRKKAPTASITELNSDNRSSLERWWDNYIGEAMNTVPKGYHTLPAIGIAAALPALGEAAYPILTNPIVDTGLISAGAAHGLTNVINGNINNPTDAAITALELLPLGRLARPVARTAMEGVNNAWNWTRNKIISNTMNKSLSDEYLKSPAYLEELFKDLTTLPQQRIKAINPGVWDRAMKDHNYKFGNSNWVSNTVEEDGLFFATPESKSYMVYSTEDAPIEHYVTLAKYPLTITEGGLKASLDGNSRPILTNSIVDTGLISAEAALGLTNVINGNINNTTDAAMTALELLPLGRLARPVARTAMEGVNNAWNWTRNKIISNTMNITLKRNINGALYEYPGLNALPIEATTGVYYDPVLRLFVSAKFSYPYLGLVANEARSPWVSADAAPLFPTINEVVPRITSENAFLMTDTQWDAAYFDAIIRGDRAEVLRLRDLHFMYSAPNTTLSKAGLPIKNYHTVLDEYNPNFTEFYPEIKGTHSAIYSADYRPMSASYAYNPNEPGRVKELYINMLNPYIVNGMKSNWDNLTVPIYKNMSLLEALQADAELYRKLLNLILQEYEIGELYYSPILANPEFNEGETLYFESAMKKLMEIKDINRRKEIAVKIANVESPSLYTRYGLRTRDVEHAVSLHPEYDGVIFNDISDWGKATGDKIENLTLFAGDSRFNLVLATFKPSNLKLANPITYDDAGDIIPLSLRDNFNLTDMRYSITPFVLGGVGLGIYGVANSNNSFAGGQ